MEKQPRPVKEPKTGQPERSIEAPSLVWWMLAIVAIIGFSGLAYWLGSVS